MAEGLGVLTGFGLRNLGVIGRRFRVWALGFGGGRV